MNEIEKFSGRLSFYTHFKVLLNDLKDFDVFRVSGSVSRRAYVKVPFPVKNTDTVSAGKRVVVYCCDAITKRHIFLIVNEGCIFQVPMFFYNKSRKLSAIGFGGEVCKFPRCEDNI